MASAFPWLPLPAGERTLPHMLTLQAERFANRPMWEQDALRYQMGRNKWMNGQVCWLPRRSLNAVHRECVNRNFPDAAPYPYQQGDFLLHLTNVDRVRILNEMGL